MIREALEAFTFQWSQSANQLRSARSLQDKIRGVFVLAGALGADHLTVLEHIHPLSAEDRMVVSGSQSIGDVLLITNAISTILGLSVDGVASDAEYRFLLN